MTARPRPLVSVVIKALNEERHIASAIESALAALDGIDGEVVLADSASTDRTVAIAKNYPIKIVCMNRIEDRSCGAGGQLGYQYSGGDYVCLMDGDMRLYPDFVAAAIRYLEQNPKMAGVGGLIVEREKQSFEYAKRATSNDPDLRPGEVARLDCGGVYRRTAIESVGYLTDCNLHSAEEMELGARLREKGWTLARINRPAIDHYGHPGNAFRLLRQRWASRLAFGMGEILRTMIGARHSRLMLDQIKRHALLLAAVHVWWLCLLAAPLIVRGPLPAAGAMAMLGLFPFAVMSARCRSISLGIYSVTAWNVYALGIWPGLLQRRVDPRQWIDSSVVWDPRSSADHADAAVNSSSNEAPRMTKRIAASPLATIESGS